MQAASPATAAQAATRVALFLLSSVACVAVLANAASSLLLENGFDRAALAINPLNQGARAALAMSVHNDTDNRSEELLELAQAGLRLAPADARFLSLAGMAFERTGDLTRSKQHFEAALKQSPAELQALMRKFDSSFRSGDRLAAVAYGERLARRWPKLWPALAAYFPDLLKDPKALEALAGRFSSDRSLRANLIEQLMAKDETLGFAVSIILEWQKAGVAGLRPQIDMLTSRLVGAGQISEAYLLFRLTRSAEELAVAGFVNNGDFRLKSAGNPFEWVISGVSGASISFVNTPKSLKDESEKSGLKNLGEHSLEVRFLDSPVQLTRPTQFVRLAPAQWTFEMIYSTEGLRLPKPIKAGLFCEPGHRLIGETEISEADVGLAVKRFSATVPNVQCGFQQIQFYNGKMPESWKNRYSGRLLIHSISLTFVGG